MPTRQLEQRYRIPAPIDAVWRALTEVEGYDRWNPFVVSVTSDAPGATVGAMMALSVRWHDGGAVSSREQVTVAEAPSAQPGGGFGAVWEYQYRSWMCALGLIRSVRRQTLSQAPGAPTIYVTSIHLSGWGAGGAPLAKIERGMRDQAEALRAHVLGAG